MAKQTTETEVGQSTIDALVWRKLGGLEITHTVEVNVYDIRSDIMNNNAVKDLTEKEILTALVHTYKKCCGIKTVGLGEVDETSGRCIITLALTILPTYEQYSALACDY